MESDKINSEVDKLWGSIVNMLAKNATDNEIKRVIKHSIAVIDCKRSYEGNGIAEIEAKYQNS